MAVHDEAAEIDFDKQTWNDARSSFTKNHKKKNYEEFLKNYETPDGARQAVARAKATASAEYSSKLGGILSKIDMFMKASTDILGILISCRVWGRMYSTKQGPSDFQEIHDKVIGYIPTIYADIIEFSYAMYKHAGDATGVRIIKGLFRGAQSKFQPMIQGLRDNEVKMNGYATTASQQLSMYYQKEGLANDKSLMSAMTEMSQALDSSRKDSQMILDFMQKQEELHKRQSGKTAYELANETMEKQLTDLSASNDNKDMLEEKISARKEGTCRWIVNSDQFKTFSSSPRGNLTWLVGVGGTGKSFLMATAIEELLVKSQNEDVPSLVQYFFITRGSESTAKTDRIQRQLLAQLYEASKDSLDTLDKCNKIMSGYLKSNGAGASSKATTQKPKSDEKSFIKTYCETAKLLDKRIFLFIDALDECDDRQTQHLIESIQEIVTQEDIRVNVIFSSRDEPDINTALKGCVRINVEENNADDIQHHIKLELEKLPGLTTAERELACQQIAQKAGSFFQYVNLAMDFMKRPWRRPLEKHLENLPEGISNLYSQRLQQTDPAYFDLLTTCLTWTCLAGGDIRAEELIDAFSGTYTASSEAQVDGETADTQLFEDQITTAGSGFIRVDNSLVSLVHNTVRDYFITSSETNAANLSQVASKEEECQCARCRAAVKEQRKFTISAREGHVAILTAILQHLLAPSFQEKFYRSKEKVEAEEEDEEDNENKNESQDTGNDTNEGTTANGDGNKDATTYINGGVELVQESTDQQKEPDAAVNGDKSINGLEESAEKSVNHDEENSETPISKEDKGDAVNQDEADEKSSVSSEPPESIADSDEEMDTSDEDRIYDYETREGAVINRYEIDMLMNHLCELELLWPVKERAGTEWESFRELLDQFFVNDSEAFRGWIRTLWMTESALVVLSDVDEHEKIHPLHVAVGYGLASVTGVILSRPDVATFVNLPLPSGLEPLHFAGVALINDMLPNDSLFEMLLEKGANANATLYNEATDQRFTTPFHLYVANEKATVPVVEAFLRYGGKMDFLDETGMMALHFYAGGAAGIEVGKVLLNAGADIHARSKLGETAMHMLVRRTELPLDIINEFIERGAEIDVDDDASQRPLFEVSLAGHVEGVKLLIAAGADIHDDDQFGQTALHAAAGMGRTEVVQLLLDNGADPTIVNKIGATAFGRACKDGNEDCAMILGKAMVEKDRKDLFKLKNPVGKFALTRAAARDFPRVIEFFLANCEDPKAALQQTTDKGRHALHFSAMKGRKAATELLLKHGADAKTKDKKGFTPLQLCYSKVVGKPNAEREDTLLLLIEHDPESAILDIELMHMLCVNGVDRLVSRLLELGADPYAKDEHGWNALELAEQYDKAKVVDLIQRRKPKSELGPTRFAGKASQSHKFSDDGLEAQLVELGEQIQITLVGLYWGVRTTDVAIVADHPISASSEKYYYEISIEDSVKHEKKLFLGMGLCQRPTGSLEHWYPGWPKAGVSSWGYHGDDGAIIRNDDSQSAKDVGSATTFGDGDTVGCGVDLKKRTIFWTLNGKRLMNAAWQNVRGQLYPVFTMGGLCKATANLGTDLENKPFMWAPGNTLDFDSDIPPPTLKRSKTNEFRSEK